MLVQLELPPCHREWHRWLDFLQEHLLVLQARIEGHRSRWAAILICDLQFNSRRFQHEGNFVVLILKLITIVILFREMESISINLHHPEVIFIILIIQLSFSSWTKFLFWMLILECLFWSLLYVIRCLISIGERIMSIRPSVVEISRSNVYFLMRFIIFFWDYEACS